MNNETQSGHLIVHPRGRKRAAVVVVLLAMAQIAEAQETWRDCSYPYRREITLENDNMDSTLSNFTMLINLVDGDAVDKDNIADGRYTFYDSSGNELDFQNEAYSEGASFVNMETWVETVTLNADDTTTTDDSIWIYYGYDGGDQDDGTGAWNADGNWEGVWHLDENVADEGSHADSSGTGNTGTRQDDDASGGGNATGRIGGADAFDGTDDFVDLGEAQWDGSPSGNTYMFWVQRTGAGTVGVAAIEIVLGKGAGHGEGFAFGANESDQVFAARMKQTNTYSSLTMVDDTWYHVAPL